MQIIVIWGLKLLISSVIQSDIFKGILGVKPFLKFVIIFLIGLSFTEVTRYIVSGWQTVLILLRKLI